MKNETRLTILKLSCICGGMISLILLGLYVFFVVAFPGTVKFMPIQVVLLLAGIVSVTVFSYMHLNYAKDNPEEFSCPILSGIIITVICLSSGLISTIPLLPRLSHKNVLTPTYMLPRFLGRLPAYLSWEESEIHEVLSD